MQFYNRVKFATATTGTGTITAGSAESGFRTMAGADIADGTIIAYVIEDGSDWETGYGTVGGSSTTLSRVARQSSNSDALIDLSGSAVVRITPLAEDITGWQQVIDQSGASFASWTGLSGTWSSNGTEIIQTNTSGDWRAAYFTTQQPLGAPYILQADIQALSAGAGALHVVGLITAFAGTLAAAGAEVDLRLSGGNRVLHFMRLVGTDIASFTHSWNDDTWYTLRVLNNGAMASGYVNGALVGTAGNLTNNAADSRYIGLSSWGCSVKFRNIKAWTLVLP